jgi:hypothetical protein
VYKCALRATQKQHLQAERAKEADAKQKYGPVIVMMTLQQLA